LLFERLEPQGDIRGRKLRPRHAVEEITQILDGYPAPHRRLEQYLALPVPLRPDRIAPIDPSDDLLCQPTHRMWVADVAQRRALHIVKQELFDGPNAFVFFHSGLPCWRQSVIRPRIYTLTLRTLAPNR